jgi:hypothetical protein
MVGSDYFREDADGWTPVSLSGHLFGTSVVFDGGFERDRVERIEVSLCLLHSVPDGA